ncbi:uncharacterized protein LOC143279361 isoform X2 [Babylonia areolata]
MASSRLSRLPIFVVVAFVVLLSPMSQVSATAGPVVGSAGDAEEGRRMMMAQVSRGGLQQIPPRAPAFPDNPQPPLPSSLASSLLLQILRSEATLQHQHQLQQNHNQQPQQPLYLLQRLQQQQQQQESPNDADDEEDNNNNNNSINNFDDDDTITTTDNNNNNNDNDNNNDIDVVEKRVFCNRFTGCGGRHREMVRRRRLLGKRLIPLLVKRRICTSFGCFKTSAPSTGQATFRRRTRLFQPSKTFTKAVKEEEERREEEEVKEGGRSDVEPVKRLFCNGYGGCQGGRKRSLFSPWMSKMNSVADSLR